MKIKNNKKGQVLAIGILVFLTLSITTTSIFYILIKEGKVEERIANVDLMDRTYSRENRLNIYLQDIVDSSARSVILEKDFVDKFRNLVEEYKVQGGSELHSGDKKKYPFLFDENVLVMDELAKNLKEGDVKIFERDGERIVEVKFNVVIEDKFYDFKNEEESFNLKYSYEKVFEGKT
tara:strand:- start:779 stop:1312 length:534 start_codon:yes stop_codon:yes gene_type:complete